VAIITRGSCGDESGIGIIARVAIGSEQLHLPIDMVGMVQNGCPYHKTRELVHIGRSVDKSLYSHCTREDCYGIQSTRTDRPSQGKTFQWGFMKGRRLKLLLLTYPMTFFCGVEYHVE